MRCYDTGDLCSGWVDVDRRGCTSRGWAKNILGIGGRPRSLHEPRVACQAACAADASCKVAFLKIQVAVGVRYHETFPDNAYAACYLISKGCDRLWRDITAPSSVWYNPAWGAPAPPQSTLPSPPPPHPPPPSYPVYALPHNAWYPSSPPSPNPHRSLPQTPALKPVTNPTATAPPASPTAAAPSAPSASPHSPAVNPPSEAPTPSGPAEPSSSGGCFDAASTLACRLLAPFGHGTTAASAYDQCFGPDSETSAALVPMRRLRAGTPARPMNATKPLRMRRYVG